ncbi:MAG: tetratricopeptide repeat protein, partial [Methylocella sp.]
YADGQGVAQDYAEAVKWTRKAADRGFAKAQSNLGNMYYKGQGVAQDYAEAAKWWRLAADQGLTDAQYSLGDSYAFGEGVPQDYIRAHMWFNLAAAQGAEGALKNRDIVARNMTPGSNRRGAAAGAGMEAQAVKSIAADRRPFHAWRSGCFGRDRR